MNAFLRCASLALALLASCTEETSTTPGAVESSANGEPQRSITLWWFQWAPADGLAELGADFEAETGIAVNVEQIPLSSYQDKVNLEFGNKRTRFDIVIGDSQWIGGGAKKGLYVELTDWLPTVVDLESIHARAARYLCEYPEQSGHWYAAPCETDACGLVYRKDWFDDAKEKEAFRAKHGRELAVPGTWEEFEQVAAFFHRPEEKRYGCAFPTARAYDSLTMGFQNLLWAFGGKWHAEDGYAVKGHLDVPGTVAAVEFFRRLIALGPKGAENLDYGQALEAFTNGSTAMLVNYFAFFPGIHADFGTKAGFAVVPAGPHGRVASLGGQGLSISTKIPPDQQALCKQFIAWFLSRTTQEKWITKPAGFTANVEILSSAAFRERTPYNGPFADSIDTMRDFWNVPCFNELLSVTQKYIGMAIDGEMPTQEALEKLAIEKERILKEQGLL